METASITGPPPSLYEMCARSSTLDSGKSGFCASKSRGSSGDGGDADCGGRAERVRLGSTSCAKVVILFVGAGGRGRTD